jgi:hypothetical protein
MSGGYGAQPAEDAGSEPAGTQSPAFTDVVPETVSDTTLEESEASAGGSAASDTEPAQNSDVAGQTSAAPSDVNNGEAPGADAEETTE